MKRRIAEIAARAALPILWLFDLHGTSDMIDSSDTPSYVDFHGTVGFRFPVTALVRIFLRLGLEPAHAAWFLNTLAVVYLFFLVDRIAKRPVQENPFTRLAIFSCSALLVLAKNNLFTDFYAGLLMTHAILRIEEVRTERCLGWKSSFGTAALLILAMNVKETAVLLIAAYLLARTFSGGWSHVARDSVIRLGVALLIGWAIVRGFYAGIYGNPWYDYREIFFKSKGGNTPYEIVGARTSIPVPLVFFHLFTQLKAVGRPGVAAVTVLLGLWKFRNILWTRVYGIGLVALTLLASRGILTLERYQGIFLPLQLCLFSEVVRRLGESQRWRWAVPCIVGSGVILSAANYHFRYGWVR